MAIELINDTPPPAPAATPAPAAAPVAEPPAAPAAAVVAPAPSPELAALLEEVRALKERVGTTPAPAATPPAATDPEEDLAVLLMTDPEEAFGRLMTKREKKLVADKVALKAKLDQANSVIREAHPDLDTINASGEFVKWVGSDPRYQAAYERSEREIDGAARSLLLDLFKVAKAPTSDPVAEAAAENRKAAAASGPLKGGHAVENVKTMRETDIRDLMDKDWDRYNAMLPEIRQAYLEGRVTK